MKKLGLLFLSICFAGLSVAAQEMHFGLKAGLNIANITNTSSDGSRAAFHIGAFARTYLDEKWAFQPEILYSGQGNKYEVLDEKFKTALGYLNVPLMVQYYIVPAFNLEIGPQVGFKLGAKIKHEGDSEDVGEQFKTADLGLGLGCGYEISRGLGVSFRYVFGLTDIAEASFFGLVNDGRQSNSLAQFSLFYRFK